MKLFNVKMIKLYFRIQTNYIKNINFGNKFNPLSLK